MNILAARDQENLVHAHQTTAAAKPLNGGVRALHPKTPGPSKTPFRHARNDENRPLGLENLKTGGKAIQNAFITPVGPRTRAPLGAKTTNAKAGAFKTPAPVQQFAKPQQTILQSSVKRRSAKSKIIVPPSQPVETDVLQKDDEDDYPEIEYAPPPPVELPDLPFEFEYNQDMPQFNPENMFRGWQELYPSPKDENGFSLRLKKEQEEKRQFEKWAQEQLDQTLEPFKAPVDPDKLVEEMIAAGPKKRIRESKVDTLKATSAAAALSQQTQLPRAMQPTASSLQKTKKATASTISSKLAPISVNPSPMRHAASAAVSKNTIGFPKAARPASIIPKKDRAPEQENDSAGKVDWRNMDVNDFVKLYGEPPEDSELWWRLQQQKWRREDDKDEQDELADGLFDMEQLRVGLDDEEEDFEMPLPE